MASTLPFMLLLLLLVPAFAGAFNITTILSQFPDFSALNNLLSRTGLAAEINRRDTLTVLAADNAAVSAAAGRPLDLIKKVLSLHVVLDYYDDAKLRKMTNRTAALPTLFQASGLASGLAGFLNVTDMPNGDVAFGSAVPGAPLSSKFVKVLVTHPYSISVLQLSSVIVPPGVSAGTNNTQSAPTPSPNAAPVPAPAPSRPKPRAPTMPPTPAPVSGGPIPSPIGSPPIPKAPIASPPAPVAYRVSPANAPGPVAGGDAAAMTTREVAGRIGIVVAFVAALGGVL
ncbi:fasciclin-like arabinogalactan protein 14 [Ananas comosus]|uniref:Fasciclin-like arabinogalactan protein 14 n=1 Tax=Ananas comosus TaxID=4615 RepID=A0A199UY59_ANACO|nr:fasciclin-like arabinogalactan protein 14 [Ananas comosus]OAY69709.1 Fasciclin-like arabinogalactan protein 14 [Ananas comosus]